VAQRYDSIGRVYARHRAADPRIGQQITRALGGAHSVLNVGAGAGAYEPSERRVVAVEPSTVMIAQRSPRAAPVVQGVAEALPFPDQSFDAALATFTVHHWKDSSRGLREMSRVAPRQVILTFDQGDEWLEDFWLTRDYLPQAHFRGALFSGLSEVLTEIEAPSIEVVPVPFDCRDGFFCAYWRRPHSYLDPDVRASISALALLDDEVLAPGLARLEADLRSGAWHERNHTLLELDTCDFGYRLVVT
jgi:SAM-dependent methyltransferase